jgi:low affinity Fe/Cu permease
MTTERPAKSHQSPFVRFTDAVARLSGSPLATIFAFVAIGTWIVTGPLFHFSDTWQLIINTGTTVLTFVMVFVIQATQLRDSTALHVKLDELIEVTAGASNRAIGVERSTEKEIEAMRERIEAHAEGAGESAPGQGSTSQGV